MAQPSSTQPEPQATVAKSDVETPDQPVTPVSAKDEAAKPQDPTASQPAESTSPPQTDAAKAVEAPAANAADPAAFAKAPETPVTAPTDPAADAAAAPTLPNVSASQVAAALQASASQPAPTTEAPPPAAAEPAKKGEPSFLYVEDDPFSREVITRLIKQNMGFPNLTVFADSSDFMARVKNLPAVPDVFLLDIQISPLNGHQMLKLLRDDEAFKQSKIIALTASVMASEVKQLQDAGFDGLIGKPVMKRVFPELLQKVLDGEPVWYVS